MAFEAMFPTAILTEAVNKAARVAPTKGAAGDRAGGILLDFNTSLGFLVIRSTDLETSFKTVVHSDEIQGESATYRVSSIMLDGVLSSFPQGESDAITFIGRDDTKLRLKCGTSLTALTIMDHTSFPQEQVGGDLDFLPAGDLPGKVDQVAWAVSRNKGSSLAGVRMDGTHLYACNEQAVARVPCQVGVGRAITAPLETLRALLRSASDVSMAADNNRLYIRLDEHTEVSTTLIALDYPNVLQLFREDFLGSIRVHKMALVEKLEQITSVLKLERQQRVTISLDPSGLMKKFIMDATAGELARMRVELQVETEYENAMELTFIPAQLKDIVNNAIGEYVTIDFGVVGDPQRIHSVRVTDDKTYVAYLMPLKI